MKHRAVLVPAVTAVSIFKLVLLLFPLGALASRPLDGKWLVGLLALVVVVVAQPVVTFAVVRGREHDRGPAVLAAVEFLLTLPPLFLLGGNWSALPTLGLADVLLCTAGRLRLVVVAAGATAYVVGCVVNFAGAALAQQLGEAGLTVTIFYAVLRMATFVRELAQARVELARLAVGEERLRMARDLHDSLGHTLTVGLVKLELARRVSAVDPERGHRELGEVSQLLRDSMSAVQDVVAGAGDTSLAGEIAGARSVLASAGITTTVDVDEGPLRPEVEQALGWVVREGTTNVLRHSAATACTIEMAHHDDGTVVLTMRNDAPAPELRWAPSGGQGVEGMRHRLAAVGGDLAVHSDDGGYRMVASVPGEVGP